MRPENINTELISDVIVRVTCRIEEELSVGPTLQLGSRPESTVRQATSVALKEVSVFWVY